MGQPVLLLVRICAFLLAAVVFELIRRGKLKDQLGIVWLVSSIIVVALTLWSSLWITISGWLGIYYEPALFFLAGMLFCVALLLYLTAMFSKLEREKEILSQHIGLLQLRLEQLEKKIENSD
jgi:hypothetical protein